MIGALDYILTRTQFAHPFTSMGDVAGNNTIYFIRNNPIEAIMNTGGIIDTYGGELVRFDFTINLLQARGLDRGVLVSYGKNIVGIQEDLNENGMCTRMMRVGKDGLVLTEKYINSFPPKMYYILVVFLSLPTVCRLRLKIFHYSNRIRKPATK